MGKSGAGRGGFHTSDSSGYDDGSVTITATPNSGIGTAYRFTFSLNRWFIWNASDDDNTPDYNRTWRSSRGYRTPSYQELTSAVPFREDGSRGVGSSWGEWGSILGYNTSPGAISSNTYMGSVWEKEIIVR